MAATGSVRSGLSGSTVVDAEDHAHYRNSSKPQHSSLTKYQPLDQGAARTFNLLDDSGAKGRKYQLVINKSPNASYVRPYGVDSRSATPTIGHGTLPKHSGYNSATLHESYATPTEQSPNSVAESEEGNKEWADIASISSRFLLEVDPDWKRFADIRARIKRTGKGFVVKLLRQKAPRKSWEVGSNDPVDVSVVEVGLAEVSTDGARYELDASRALSELDASTPSEPNSHVQSRTTREFYGSPADLHTDSECCATITEPVQAIWNGGHESTEVYEVNTPLISTCQERSTDVETDPMSTCSGSLPLSSLQNLSDRGYEPLSRSSDSLRGAREQSTVPCWEYLHRSTTPVASNTQTVSRGLSVVRTVSRTNMDGNNTVPHHSPQSDTVEKKTHKWTELRSSSYGTDFLPESETERMSRNDDSEDQQSIAEQQRLAIAERLWSSLQDAQAKVLGSEHHLTARANHSLAMSRLRGHRDQSTLDVFLKTVRFASKTLGSVHPVVRSCLRDLQLLQDAMRDGQSPVDIEVNPYTYESTASSDGSIRSITTPAADDSSPTMARLLVGTPPEPPGPVAAESPGPARRHEESEPLGTAVLVPHTAEGAVSPQYEDVSIGCSNKDIPMIPSEPRRTHDVHRLQLRGRRVTQTAGAIVAVDDHIEQPRVRSLKGGTSAPFLPPRSSLSNSSKRKPLGAKQEYLPSEAVTDHYGFKQVPEQPYHKGVLPRSDTPVRDNPNPVVSECSTPVVPISCCVGPSISMYDPNTPRWESPDAASVTRRYFLKHWTDMYRPKPERKNPLRVLSGLAIEAVASVSLQSIAWLVKNYGPEPAVPPNHVRVRWTCVCGKRLFDDFVERRRGAARELEAYLSRPRASTHSPGGTSTSGGSSSVSGMYSTSPLQHTANALDLQNQGDISLSRLGKPPSSSDPSLEINNPLSITIRPPPEPPFLLTCANDGRYTPKLEHVPMDEAKITSDKYLAKKLRKLYFEKNRRWYKALKLRGLTTIVFVEFEVHQNRFTDIRACPAMPPLNSRDYIFEPADLIPPVGSQYLLHLFEHPEDYDRERTAYLRMPKKRGRLDAGVGYGISLVEGFLADRVWAFIVIIFVVGSLAFAVTWTCVKQDIQGAFGVAAWICTLAALTTGWVQTRLD